MTRRVLFLLALVGLGCGDNLTGPPPGAVMVVVQPGSATVPPGGMAQLTATVTGTNDTRVTWSVAPAGGGSIDAGGLYRAPATPPADPRVTVRATSVADPAASGSAMVTIGAVRTPAAIEVMPDPAVLGVGETLDLAAIATYADGSSADVTADVAWSASPQSVVRVNGPGQALGQSPGQATVTATLAGVSGTGRITVVKAALTDILVTPDDARVTRGGTQAYTATGVLADGSTADVTTAVVWATGQAGVATVSNAAGSQGRATAVAVGDTPVTATVDTPAGARTGMGRITVTAATLESIQVTPGGTTLPRGAGQAFTATGMYSDGSTADVTEQATWSSSDSAVATVGNAPGQRGVAITADAGTTRITAAVGGVTGSIDLDVSDVTLQSIALEPGDVQVDRGDTIDFRATGRYSDGSTRDLTDFATWRSTNTRAVVVSDAPGSKGEARALDSGDAAVEASLAGRTGTAQVRVGG